MKKRKKKERNKIRDRTVFKHKQITTLDLVGWLKILTLIMQKKKREEKIWLLH